MKAEDRGRKTEDRRPRTADRRTAVRAALTTAGGPTPGHEPRATDHDSRVTGHDPRATTCRHCVYARRPTGRWLRLILSRWMGLLLCTNHPDAQGEVIGMPACNSCPNFRPRPTPVERLEVGDQRGLLVCTIPLTQRKVALVDAADFERVNAFTWCACRVGKQWYAYRKHFGKTLRMHQFIMNPPKGMVVDHANGNGLDNRRENLRICTMLENAWNKRRRKAEGASTQYIGVYPCPGRRDKWCIKVQCRGEATTRSPFDTPEEAARARDRKALELFGEYAMLNFPAERAQRLREIEEEKRTAEMDSRRDAETRGE